MLFVDNFFVQVDKKGELLKGIQEGRFYTFLHNKMNTFFEK